MVIQATNHAFNPYESNWLAERLEGLAMAVAIAQVIADWITAEVRWRNRRWSLGISGTPRRLRRQ
jgi:hypothetical protein